MKIKLTVHPFWAIVFIICEILETLGIILKTSHVIKLSWSIILIPLRIKIGIVVFLVLMALIALILYQIKTKL